MVKAVHDIFFDPETGLPNYGPQNVLGQHPHCLKIGRTETAFAQNRALFEFWAKEQFNLSYASTNHDQAFLTIDEKLVGEKACYSAYKSVFVEDWNAGRLRPEFYNNNLQFTSGGVNYRQEFDGKTMSWRYINLDATLLKQKAANLAAEEEGMIEPDEEGNIIAPPVSPVGITYDKPTVDPTWLEKKRQEAKEKHQQAKDTLHTLKVDSAAKLNALRADGKRRAKWLSVKAARTLIKASTGSKDTIAHALIDRGCPRALAIKASQRANSQTFAHVSIDEDEERDREEKERDDDDVGDREDGSSAEKQKAVSRKDPVLEYAVEYYENNIAEFLEARDAAWKRSIPYRIYKEYKKHFKPGTCSAPFGIILFVYFTYKQTLN